MPRRWHITSIASSIAVLDSPTLCGPASAMARWRTLEAKMIRVAPPGQELAQ
jgi:hypothetical protein